MRTARILILVIACFASIAVQCQEFKLKKLELAGDRLLMHYDLVDTAKNRRYSIHVYSSRDNFVHPLTKVTGAVGSEVPPGMNKTIVWAAREELGASFDGKVSLEIRGRVYVPFVRFNRFEDYKVLKRGKVYPITWTGGTRQNILNFDLYRGDTKVWTQHSVANTGHFDMVIPRSVKPGKDYHFKVTDSKNRDEIVTTGSFVVRRKVSLGLKALAVVPVAVAAYFLFRDPQSEGITNPPVPTEKDKY